MSNILIYGVTIKKYVKLDMEHMIKFIKFKILKQGILCNEWKEKVKFIGIE